MQFGSSKWLKVISVVTSILLAATQGPSLRAQPDNTGSVLSEYRSSDGESSATSNNERAPSVQLRHRAGLPFVSEPGIKRSIGFDAPESDAIKILLFDVARYRDELREEDFGKLDDATLLVANRNYVTSEVLDSCRRLLAMNGVYVSKQQLAKSIADELVAVDESESKYVKQVFYDLVASVSPQAQAFLIAEKARIHAKTRTAIEDYIHTSESNPDSLIERRVKFCSRI